MCWMMVKCFSIVANKVHIFGAWSKHSLLPSAIICAKYKASIASPQSPLERWGTNFPRHYNDVIMSAITSKITSLTIVYSTVYSYADQSKHQSSRVTGFCAGNSPVTGEFPAQMASNAENVSIWWRHHGIVWLRHTGHTNQANFSKYHRPELRKS